ncbi:uncharacterized protein LOC129722375 isoform X2 [Wyeomyia smithii]|uniref:uncharacterized protein LOC129722375 isoform X2 n=1 Tax=Wyeomyia smithii TaxID=174621 RepID=UPI002467C441|nr:uncharacterized protein LOC129722375 isoform X2 [Wyeomyia smithii]
MTVLKNTYILLALIIFSNAASIKANEKDQQHLEAKPQFFDHNNVKGNNQIREQIRTPNYAAVQQPQRPYPSSRYRQDGAVQSDIPAGALLSPVGENVGGLLGGLVGGLVQGLGLGLGLNLQRPNSNQCNSYPNGAYYNCHSCCRKETPNCVGSIPTIYMSRIVNEGLNWEHLQDQPWVATRKTQDDANMYWLYPQQFANLRAGSSPDLFNSNAIFEQKHQS